MNLTQGQGSESRNSESDSAAGVLTRAPRSHLDCQQAEAATHGAAVLQQVGLHVLHDQVQPRPLPQHIAQPINAGSPSDSERQGMAT